MQSDVIHREIAVAKRVADRLDDPQSRREAAAYIAELERLLITVEESAPAILI